MTSSRKFLQKAPAGFAFFIGKSKRDAYKNYLDSNLSVFECPAKIIDEIKEGYVFTNIDCSTDLSCPLASCHPSNDHHKLRSKTWKGQYTYPADEKITVYPLNDVVNFSNQLN